MKSIFSRGAQAIRRASLLIACLTAAGCSSTPGGGFTLFPAGDRLLDSAREFRESATDQAPMPRELQKTVLPAYYIEPGDGLLIEPAQFDSPIRFPSDQVVLADGTVDLGQYGRLQVVGKTVEEIEEAVTATVEAKTKDAGPINVRLVNPQSKVYYVLGEVNTPGSFPINGRETVLDAIVAAGDLNSRAACDQIILSRPTAPDGCRIVLPICYREIVQLGDTSTNYQIQPGDRIYVPTRSFLGSLCKKDKKKCLPCNRPQSLCPEFIGDNCGASCGTCAPPAVHETVVAPVEH